VLVFGQRPPLPLRRLRLLQPDVPTDRLGQSHPVGKRQFDIGLRDGDLRDAVLAHLAPHGTISNGSLATRVE